MLHGVEGYHLIKILSRNDAQRKITILIRVRLKDSHTYKVIIMDLCHFTFKLLVAKQVQLYAHIFLSDRFINFVQSSSCQMTVSFLQ